MSANEVETGEIVEKENDQSVDVNEEKKKPREIRFAEGERKRYPAVWLKEIAPLISTEPKLASEGKIVLKSEYGQSFKSTAPMSSQGHPRGGVGGGVGPPGPRSERMVFPHGVDPRGSITRKPLPVSDQIGNKFAKVRDAPPRIPPPMTIPIRGKVITSRVQPVYEGPPVAPLPTPSESAWKRVSKDSEEDVVRKVKELRSVLNKITLQTFDRLYKQIYEIEITNKELLDQFTREIFEKAVFQPNFSGMYADMCFRLQKDTEPLFVEKGFKDEKGKACNIRRTLLLIFREEFGGDAAKTEIGKVKLPDNLDTYSEEDQVIIQMKAKRRLTGSIKFLGELYKRGLIPDKVIVEQCIVPLISAVKKTRREDVAEALCVLIGTIGPKAEAKWAKNDDMATKRRMDDFFRDITSFSRDKGFPSRVQFLFADLVDTRNANWESARQMAPQAKKISEIHEDAKREEEAKMAQMNNPGRDMRGGNVGNRRSFQTNFQPPQQQNMNKMTMHMHNRPSNQIQTTNRLDSQAKRFSTSRPGTFKPVNVELKPGGGGGGGLMKFGGLRSLDNSRAPAQGNSKSSDAALIRPAQNTARTAPPAKPVETRMDPDLLARRSNNMLGEYEKNQNKEDTLLEFQSIPKVDHQDFVSLLIRSALEAKASLRNKTNEIFLILVEGDDPPLKGQDLVKGAASVLEELDDLEIDAPQAGELIAQFLCPALAAVNSDEQLLPTLKEALNEVSPLRQMTFGVKFLAIYAAAKKDLSEAQVKELYRHFDIDLLSIAKSWNESKGEEKLQSMLKDNNLSHILQA